jgi:hypothetical protein
VTPSSHARYRSQLCALEEGCFEHALPCGDDWVRRYGRFEPDREPFATLVVERRGEMLRLDVFTSPAEGRRRSEAGWLRFSSFAADERLPTLPDVLRSPGRWTVMRYLPGRRCTLRLDEPNQPPRFAKVYADDRGERADTAARRLWSAADLEFDLPEPDHWDACTRALWQHSLPGTPAIAELYGTNGAQMARRIGHANASLAQSSLELPGVFDADAQMRHSAATGAELSRRVPALGPAVDALLRAVSDVHAAFNRPPKPIHGDPHAEQWLVTQHQRLGLLDFETCAMGDPELDAAVFLAELDFEDTLELPVERLEAAYLDGARARGLCLDPRLLQAYRAHKRLAKALRSARAIRPDGDARAEAHLRRALECAAA